MEQEKGEIGKKRYFYLVGGCVLVIGACIDMIYSPTAWYKDIGLLAAGVLGMLIGYNTKKKASIVWQRILLVLIILLWLYAVIVK